MKIRTKSIFTFALITLSLLCIVLVTSFGSRPIRNLANQCTISSSRLGNSNMSWLLNRWRDFTTKDNTMEDRNLDSKFKNTNKDAMEKNKNVNGKVIRCGARHFKDDGSYKPSSMKYTTIKNEYPSLKIDASGVVGDYNHYRTTSLSSTRDRAVSILTNDIIKILNNEGVYSISPGDLGENILVDEITYRYFHVGNKYFIGDSSSGPASDMKLRRGIEIEITEPIEPCANLCKLPIINQSNLQPKARIKRCMNFLQRLDHDAGVRGWYAKILGNGGEVRLGDGVRSL